VSGGTHGSVVDEVLLPSGAGVLALSVVEMINVPGLNLGSF
jgi:hypothetical protein